MADLSDESRPDEPRWTAREDARLEAALRDVGEALCRARLDSELNQRRAAALTGQSQANLSRIERGEIAPPLDLLLRMQWAYGLESIESLFGPSATARLFAEIA